MPMKRVLHYMGTNVGMTGVETFILHLCAAQRRLGLVPRFTCELEGRAPLVESAAKAGLPLHDFPARNALEDRLPRKLGTASLRARRVRELVRLMREHADLVHIHAVGLHGLDAFTAALIARVPVIVTHHTTIEFARARGRSVEGDAALALERRFARRAVMSYARATPALIAAGVPESRVRVVPFCVDDKRFELGSARPDPDVFRFIMLSRLVPNKGHDDLVHTFAKARATRPELRLTFLGDGPERPGLERLIDELGVRDAVEITGWMPHEEVPERMRRAHVVVLPSHMPGETFPISLMEGMALGLPAIGSRWTGIPDIIADGKTGIVFEPEDRAGLRAAIERLADDRAFYASASRAAIERVREHFTAEAVAKAYADLYGEMI